MQIGIDSKTNARQKPARGDDIIARQAERFCKPEPTFNAAFVLRDPIVVEIALPPSPAHLAPSHFRHKRQVLTGNDSLVIIAVERPGLHLPLRKLTAMQ